MKVVDWAVFGVPAVLLLGVAMTVTFLDLPWAAKGATWACFAGFALILGRLLWAKMKN